MWEMLDIICGLLEIAAGAIAIGETIASFFRPKHLMPDYVAEIIKERLRNPCGYLAIRRVSFFLIGAGFVLRGVGDLIGIYNVQLILKALYWLLLTAGTGGCLYSYRVYLDRWLPPRKPASEKPHTEG